MDRIKALEFIDAYSYKSFYQPIIFSPDRLEIVGKWHQATKDLANIIFSNVVGKKVLDLGCNIGFFVHEALHRGALASTGIDHDIVEISIALQLLNIFNDNAKIVQSDINDFVPDCKFDIILLLNVCDVLPNPCATISRYRKFCTECLIVECDSVQQKRLPKADKIIDSPRCAFKRNLSYYSPL